MDSNGRTYREKGLRDAVLAGDETAWQSWYDESYEPVYRYVHWRCGGKREWCEEVVQETWLTAVRKIASFDPRQASFLDWLRGIAANILRNHFRQRRQLARNSQSLDVDPPGKPANDPEDAYHESVSRVLHSLPERHEQVLRAKYLDEMTVQEIAREWNQSIKAIESLLGRARASFRVSFERLEHDHERTRGTC